MLSRMLRVALRSPSLAQIRFLEPVPYRSAPAPVAIVYGSLEREFGLLAPPVALHAAAPDTLAAVWLLVREALLVPGVTARVDREQLAVEVSRANACPFCTAVHSAMLAELGRARPVTASSAPDQQSAELLAVRLLMEYLNRMANAFLGPLPLPPGVPPAALRVIGPVLLRLQRSAQTAVTEPGQSLGLLPPADLPAQLAGLSVSPVLADALGRSIHALQQAGERSVPASVRALVRSQLAEWDGTAPGPSRAWVQNATASLGPAERPAGRLALLIALASYQVDAGSVAALRSGPNPRPHSGEGPDASIVELAAWSAMAAALELVAREQVRRSVPPPTAGPPVTAPG